ncbi:MAG: TRAP transporter small permease [Paracoccus sp. (in: a-proteobacteria)]|uniref:TRAP transporter small permease n=1 Tax=Paracoccus sp. TaxID=267 RepID=UPI0026E014DE|nr:TRAP transporter small permease [Paracoccus sp. (in: a-proteobacteria)]MDO5620321.1 TRAP transporter small permease [Paracoccus sp. (in: a-proteobacteria)]
MSEVETLTEHPHPVPVPGWLSFLTRLFAGIGGATLLAMMLMTVTSVVLRSTIGRPIPGDFELIELGSAVAIFCFLPWCQINGGNVLVDFFTAKAGARTNHLLEAVGDVIFLALAALILWRMWHGAADMRQYNEQTMVLRAPVWWAFAIILPAMALLVATCAATLIGHIHSALARTEVGA